MAPPLTKEEQLKAERAERANIVRDLKDGVIRAAVVPCCYSVEEFLLGLCQFPEFRLKNLKLQEDEIGYGTDKMKLFSKHIVAAYFAPNPQLFSDIFGFPLSELHPDGLLSVRPWHDETIAVMAPHRTSNTKLLFNAITRETLAQEHKNKLSWQGNCLMLSSSLQSDIHRELGGVTRYVLLLALQDKLKAKAADELESKWQQMGVSLQLQFGWLADLPKPPLNQPSPTAPVQQQLEFMLMGWKMQRCLLPHKHAFEKCPGYHVMQYKLNSSTPIFDARRPPLKAGQLVYQAAHCKDNPGAREGTNSHYYSCAAGAGCGKSHSLVELFYNPEHFKRQSCEALRGGKCLQCESGMPEHICAFWHSTAERDAVQALLKRIAPRLKQPASLPDELRPADDPTIKGSRAASDAATAISRAPSAGIAAVPDPSSNRSFAALARSPSRPSSSSCAEALVGEPAVAQAAVQALPKITDKVEFPGLPSGKASKKTKQQAAKPASDLGSSSSSTSDAVPQQQHLQQPRDRSRAVSAEGNAASTVAVTPPRSPKAAAAAAVTPAAAAAASAAPSATAVAAGPSAVSSNGHAAVDEPAIPDAEMTDYSVPQSYEDVDEDTIYFLFQGPSSSAAVQLQWYYIDPDGLVQGPFSPSEMVAWCMDELLPITLLVYPKQPGQPPPYAAEQFWPLNDLLCYAAQSLAVSDAGYPADQEQPVHAAVQDEEMLAADELAPAAEAAHVPPAAAAAVQTAAVAIAAPAVAASSEPGPTPGPAFTGDVPAESSQGAPAATGRRTSALHVDAPPFEFKRYSPLATPAAQAEAALASMTSQPMNQATPSTDSASSSRAVLSPAAASYSPSVGVKPAITAASTDQMASSQASSYDPTSRVEAASGPSLNPALVVDSARSSAAMVGTAPGSSRAVPPTTVSSFSTPVDLGSSSSSSTASGMSTAAAAGRLGSALADVSNASSSRAAGASKRLKLNVNAAPFTPPGTSISSSTGNTPKAVTPGAGPSPSGAAASAGTNFAAVCGKLETGAKHVASSTTAARAAAAASAALAAPAAANPTAPGVVAQADEAATAAMAGLPSIMSPNKAAGALMEASRTTPTAPKVLAPAAGATAVPTSMPAVLQQTIGTGVFIPAAAPARSTSELLPVLAVQETVTPHPAEPQAVSTERDIAAGAATGGASSSTDDSNVQSAEQYPLVGSSATTAAAIPSAAAAAGTEARTGSGSEQTGDAAAVAAGTLHGSSAPTDDDDWHIVEHRHSKKHKQATALPAAAVQSSAVSLPQHQQQQVVTLPQQAAFSAAVPDSESSTQGSWPVGSLFQLLPAGGAQQAEDVQRPAVATTAAQQQPQQQQQQQGEATQMQVVLFVYDLQSAAPHQPAQLIQQSLPGSTLGSGLLPLIQLAGVDSQQSVTMLAARRTSQWPHPQLVLLQPQQQLQELCHEGQRELEVEVYCSAQGMVSKPLGIGGLPLLYQYVLLGREFRDNLWQAVCEPSDTVTAVDKDQQQKVLLTHLCKVFEAALSEGLLWRHDSEWAVFNSGLPRQQDSSQPQLIFLRRNSWPAADTAPSRPWVATKKMVSLSEATVWLKGAHNIPPSPACPPWGLSASLRQATGNGSTGSSTLTAAAAQQPEPGRADREPVWRNAGEAAVGGDGGSSSSQGYGTTQNGTALVTETMNGESSVHQLAQPGKQQQQGQEPATPVQLPFTAYLRPNSAVLDTSGASPAVANLAGMNASPAAGQGSAQQSNSSSVLQPPAVGQPALSGLASFPGLPLMALPVLPSIPGLPVSTNEPAESSQAAAAATAASPAQQHLQYYRDLSQGYPGLQMVLSCKTPGLQQQQEGLDQSQATGAGSLFSCQLLVSQGTPVEEVAAAVTQWLSEQQHEHQPTWMARKCSSAPSAVLLTYQQVDRSSGVKFWRLLQYDQLQQSELLQSTSSSSSSSSISSSSSSSSSSTGSSCETANAGDTRIAHPLGSQLMFSAVLSTLNVQVYPVFGDTDVSSLFVSCTGALPQQMLRDVRDTAAVEYWGRQHHVLQYYLADNFIRAAMQGRLVIKGTTSSSGSTSSSSAARRVLPGAVGLLARRAQQQEEQQQEQEHVLLFNTGLMTAAGQQVFVIFKEGSSGPAESGSSPWTYHSTATGFQCSALQPLPTPAAAPAVSLNPAVPVQFDLDAILRPAGVRQCLAEQLWCQGHALPKAAWHSLVRGGVAMTLLQLQRTPGIALQLLAGGRLLHVLPLFVFAGEPARLVLLVEQIVPAAGDATKAFYAGRRLASFAEVYKYVRSLGEVTWVSWAQQAVSALMQADAWDQANTVKLQLRVLPDGHVVTQLTLPNSRPS